MGTVLKTAVQDHSLVAELRSITQYLFDRFHILICFLQNHQQFHGNEQEELKSGVRVHAVIITFHLCNRPFDECRFILHQIVIFRPIAHPSISVYLFFISIWVLKNSLIVAFLFIADPLTFLFFHALKMRNRIQSQSLRDSSNGSCVSIRDERLMKRYPFHGYQASTFLWWLSYILWPNTIEIWIVDFRFH